MVESEAEILLKTTIEEMIEGLQVIDWDWRYLYVNKAVASQAFTTKEHLIGKTMMEAFPGIDKEPFFNELRFVMEKRTPRRMENEFTFPNGEKIWFELFIEPHARGVLIRSFNIAERKKLEDQFRHSQKMEAIGRLTSNLAHNFNNKLGIMRICCDLIMTRKIDDIVTSNVGKIMTAISQSVVLMKQLLSFSHHQETKPLVINPNKMLSEMKPTLQSFLGPKVAIDYQLSDSVKNIKVDLDMWEQAIVNLAINSRDAMPKGGTVTISTQTVELDENFVKIFPNMVTGKHFHMSIADTGEGMDRKTLDKIFEPYFTTKEKGQGTGLGLPMVHGFMHQYCGCVIAESELNKGSTFKLYLPYN